MTETLHVLYKSDHYIVINKNPDIVINTNEPKKHPVTVESQLKCHFPLLMNNFRFCHRLDYSTSGIICIALSKTSAKHASIAFENRYVQKYYLAIVHGHLKEEFISINEMIGNDCRADYLHCMCTSDKDYCRNPKSAITKLLVLQLGFYNNIIPATKVLLKPVTGRRHQLRVHCHYIGHTIVGDYTYSNRQDSLPHRMFLHSYKLFLPTKLENIDITTEDPFTNEDKQNLWLPLKTVNTLNKNIFFKLDYKSD